MTFAELFRIQYTIPQVLELLLRIVVACFCGAAFGIERSYRLKEAGVRTHLIVCAAAALLMIVSKYGFADITVGDFGMRGADDARIAAQVVSGVSFLCAGVIIKVGGNIRGLTTAAGLWLTAAVGLAIGSGLYLVGIFMVLLIMGCQYILHRFSFGNDSWLCGNIVIKSMPEFPLEAELSAFLAEAEGQSDLLRILYKKDVSVYYIHVRLKRAIGKDRWQDFYKKHDEIFQIDYITNLWVEETKK